MYHTIQNIAENNVTNTIAPIRLASPDVNLSLAVSSFLATVSNSRWSALKGSLPASPKALPFNINQAASINMNIAHIKNTVLKLVFIPNNPVVANIAMKVVPMKEPTFTNEY